jgi:PAS domain-containing protein
LAKLAGDPGAEPAGQRDELAAEVAACGDDLHIAEEELRVQCEELAAVRLELETVTARHEALNADRTADVITDRNGIVVEANQAAQQLFDRPGRPRGRTSFPMWFAEPDRSRIRSLISSATEAGQRRSAQVSRPGDEPAGDITLRVSVELRVEPRTGAALLCWALTPAEPEGQLLPTDPDDAVGRVLSLARADLAAQVSAEAAPDTWLARVLELAVRWVPGAEQASLCQVPGRGKLRILAATDDRALACDKIQRATGQGPTFEATVEHAPVHVDDLAQERRWRQFTEQARDLGIRSILTCELPLTRRSGYVVQL